MSWASNWPIWVKKVRWCMKCSMLDREFYAKIPCKCNNRSSYRQYQSED